MKKNKKNLFSVCSSTFTTLLKMKKNDKDFFSACTFTFTTFFMLLITILKVDRDNDVVGIITVICLVVLLGSTIAQWSKCVRKYIDRRIEEKIKEIEFQPSQELH
jgi:hypothetical protein